MQLQIIEGENGFIVREDHPGKMHEMQSFWVAENIESLREVVGKLALKSKIEKATPHD